MRARLPTRYICIAGGFKTMSASMQRAASLLGAAEVFHVLAPGAVPDVSAMDAALAASEIRYIRLGPEPGWPQLNRLSSHDFPLTRPGPGRISTPNRALTHRIADLQRAQQNLAAHFTELDTLPFPSLATHSPAQLAWLRGQLQPQADDDHAWLAALPKVELHCHLGGFATHCPALEVVRSAASNPAALPPALERSFPAHWPTPTDCCDLQAYLMLGDNNGSRLLRDPGCLRAQCESLYAALVADHIIYAEIRCSPNNYASPARPAGTVLNEIRGHFQQAIEASAGHRSDGRPACHVNLIVIATRKDRGDRSDISRHLALAITAADQWRDLHTCRVVGVDLAGFEHRDTRAALFATDFEAVHRVGLAITVHAGENDDAEGIWQAVFKLNARRLGHALHLYQSLDLLRAVADRGIALEMCP